MQALLSLQGNLHLSSNALVVIHTSIEFNISMCVEKVFVCRVYLCYKLHGADPYIFTWAYLMPSPELCISNLCSIRTHLDSLSSVQWQTSKTKEWQTARNNTCSFLLQILLALAIHLASKRNLVSTGPLVVKYELLGRWELGQKIQLLWSWKKGK